MTSEFNKILEEMIASEEYPNITDIKVNNKFTEFTITTKSTELDMSESFSVMAFYMYGGMYNIFSGDTVDEVKVDFIDIRVNTCYNSYVIRKGVYKRCQ